MKSIEKIINNSYNTGEYDFEEFGSLKVIDDTLPLDEQITNKEIENEIYRIYLLSKWYNNKKLAEKTKISKNDYIDLWLFFKQNLQIFIPEHYFFVYLCDFFEINYNKFFNALTPKVKEEIVRNVYENSKIKKILKNKKILF